MSNKYFTPAYDELKPSRKIEEIMAELVKIAVDNNIDHSQSIQTILAEFDLLRSVLSK